MATFSKLLERAVARWLNVVACASGDQRGAKRQDQKQSLVYTVQSFLIGHIKLSMLVASNSDAAKELIAVAVDAVRKKKHRKKKDRISRWRGAARIIRRAGRAGF